jgi:3-hydroxyisobutyrate dehydrogenase-like beta-hydroxyacid dehydrogenase
MASIGLIGLGNAGRPMAERILAKGHSLTVFDIDTGALAWISHKERQDASSGVYPSIIVES